MTIRNGHFVTNRSPLASQYAEPQFRFADAASNNGEVAIVATALSMPLSHGGSELLPHWIKRGGLAVTGILLAVVVAAMTVATLQGQRTPTGRPQYVALGSSFAAGAGLGPLQPGSPLLCARSINGYPQQLARMRGLSIVDMSCGGAVTRHVLLGGQFFQGSQVRVINGATQLVTITVGGNDIGYIGDLSLLAARNSSTLFGRLVRWFWNGPKQPDARHYDVVQSELTATVRKARQLAPKATIVLATYPAILPASGTCAQIGLTPKEADLMRDVGNRLADTTRAVATREGAVLVDMHKLGAGHDACSAEPWTAGWSNASIAPFHPTLAGAKATASAISAALDSLSEQSLR